MSNYPTAIDNDATLPVVNDNIDQIGEEAINALRDAVFQIEMALGTNIAGTQPSLAARLGVFINQDGYPNTSVLYNLGLVTLPVTNNQIANNAGIPESKLMLDYRTQDLYNYIRDLAKDVNVAIGWIAVSGIKLEPHLIGAIYRHDLAQIDVAETSAQFLNNVFRALRDNTDAYTLINDMNNELLAHQWADGSAFGIIRNIVTNDGSVYPSNYAHVASGIYLDTSRFVVIPQTALSVQALANYIDETSILTLGTRIQNLYANGISRNSQSSNLTSDGYGQAIVPPTPAIAFLRGTGNSSTPVDSISDGDDIIQFLPLNNSGFSFDEQFALVKPGDIITVNYAGDGYNVAVPSVISEKKYSYDMMGNQTYIVRIAGKNIAYAPNATAQINRSLFNNNKYGVLAVTGVNSPSSFRPSLIIGPPRGAQCTGVGFSPDQFNETHYNLYLALYPNGNPLDGYVFLPAIDVTGNAGTTPGSYTLDSIVTATNDAFRAPGYNYRFIAFQYNGEFGIMLADSYNNASFSVVDAVVSPTGFYSQTNTNFNFPNNVIDLFPLVGSKAPDPLGFGPFGANLASPPFLTTYGSIQSAILPTQLFVPLKRNNYYVNGNELESFPLDVSQTQDGYGDGYWIASVSDVVTGHSPGRVSITYDIPLDLSSSGLEVGKTLIVQPLNNYGLVNYGRFIIQNVNFTTCAPIQTQITVFDAVHASGFGTPPIFGGDPVPVLAVGSLVSIYFNSSSVTFNNESATDFTPISSTFKRHFEVYINQNGETFTHERGRFCLGGNVVVNGVTLYNNNLAFAQMDLVSVSPKLRGYAVGPVTKISLQLTTGTETPYAATYSGNLAFTLDGITYTNLGPTIVGRVGEVTRFYDETNIDYIDIVFEPGSTVPTSTIMNLDIQLFPTLSLDENVMLLASCQVNTQTNVVNQIVDLREFGNTSEEQFTTSALNYIAAPARHLNFNGVIRGFDVVASGVSYGNGAIISFTGGLALVNGNLAAVNDETFIIPPLQETYLSTTYPINYALCVNDEGDLVTIVLTDYDSVLGTPINSDRLVTVVNPVSSTTYVIDSCTFPYLLNDRKDLTVLYIISSTVTGSGSGTITTIENIRDVRRYVRDTDSSIPAVLTDDNSQGNFESIATAINWLTFNSTYQNTLYVKSSATLEAITFSTTPLNIVGAGNDAAIFFDGYANVSNINFTGLILSFDSAITNVSTSTFNSSTVNINSTTNTFNSVTFNNCTINFNVGTTSLTNCTFNNCTVVLSVTLALNSGCMFSECVVSNTTALATVISIGTTSKNIQFTGCTFTYLPTTSGGPYSSTNLINTGHGFIHSSSTLLQNVVISGCTFTTNTSTRFSFINFEYSALSSIMQTIHITNNQFFNTSSVDDIYAVISIIWPNPSNLTQPVEGLKLIDCIIDKNLCDKNQMIAIASGANGGGNIQSSIVTVSTRVTGNSCGSIGVLGAADNERNYNTATAGIAYDKSYGFIIADNVCRFIGNTNSAGVSCLNQTKYTSPAITFSTCSMHIQRNICNWIQLMPWIIATPTNVACYQENATVWILDNSLRAYDPAFLGLFSNNSSIFDNNGIMILPPLTNPIPAVIKGNTVIQGSALNNSNVVVTYDYAESAYIGIEAIIDSNIFSNLASTGHMLDITSATGSIMTITNNQFYRNGSTISSYINFFHTCNGVISNNSFDSPTINGSSIALISGTLTGFSFGPNYNYSQNLSRSIVQPLIFAPSGPPVIVNNSSPFGFVGFSKVINGAILASVTINYKNSGTLTSTPEFFVESFDNTNTTVTLASAVGTTVSGQQSITLNMPANTVINDATTMYDCGVVCSSTNQLELGLVVCNFTGIAYLGQN